jgi:hypothetical protein
MNMVTIIPPSANTSSFTGSNNFLEADYVARLKELGGTAGDGALSRVTAAYEGLCLVKEGAIDIDKAGVFWGVFQRARAERMGVEFKEEGSLDVQVSKFKSILKMGRLPIDGADVFERASERIKHWKSDPDVTLKSSAYDLLVKIARSQCAKGQVDKPLTDDEIDALLMPDAKKEKTTADRLKKVLKDMERIRDGTKDEPGAPSPGLDVAIDAIASTLQELAVATQDADLISYLVKGKYSRFSGAAN